METKKHKLFSKVLAYILVLAMLAMPTSSFAGGGTEPTEAEQAEQRLLMEVSDFLRADVFKGPITSRTAPYYLANIKVVTESQVSNIRSVEKTDTGFIPNDGVLVKGKQGAKITFDIPDSNTIIWGAGGAKSKVIKINKPAKNEEIKISASIETNKKGINVAPITRDLYLTVQGTSGSALQDNSVAQLDAIVEQLPNVINIASETDARNVVDFVKEKVNAITTEGTDEKAYVHYFCNANDNSAVDELGKISFASPAQGNVTFKLDFGSATKEYTANVKVGSVAGSNESGEGGSGDSGDSNSGEPGGSSETQQNEQGTKTHAGVYDGTTGKFLYQVKETVATSGLAKAWGYDSDSITENANASKVTALDVLVAAHLEKLQINSAVNDTDKARLHEELVVSNGFIKKMMGKKSPNLGITVNYRFALKSDGQGANIDETVVKEGDVLSFFFYKDTSAWSDKICWFEKDGSKIGKLEVEEGEPLSLTLKGYPVMSEGFKSDEEIKKAIEVLENVNLMVMDGAGRLKALSTVGAASGSNPYKIVLKPGEYTLTAIGSANNYLISPILKLKVVSSSMSEESKRQIAQEDADALTFDDIKGENLDINNVVSDLNLLQIGNSGKTTIKWNSDNQSVLRANQWSQDGKVTRPAMPKPDATVVLTATVDFSGVTVTKEFNITVKAINKDALDLQKLLDKVDSEGIDFALKEWNRNNRERKQDTNVIEVLKSRLKFKTDRTQDLEIGNICKSSDENVIQNDGTIIYGNREKTIRVGFVIKIGTASQERELDVTVPKREITKEEALKGDWLDFNYIKNKNSLENHIVSDLQFHAVEDNYGVKLDWESSNPGIIAIDKWAKTITVNRPEAGQADANVTLTIKIKKNDVKWNSKKFAGPEPGFAEGVRTFNLVVKAQPGAGISADQELVNEAIKIVNITSVKSLLNNEQMPLNKITYDFDTGIASMIYLKDVQGYQEAFKDIEVTWSTDVEGVTKPRLSFKVTRGDADKNGNLKVTLTYNNGAKAEKTFPVVVKGWDAQEKAQKVAEAKAAVNRVADALTFDVIKKENSYNQDIHKSLKWLKSGLVKEGSVEFLARSSSHKQGANIEWQISNEEILHKEGLEIKIKNQPEQNTEITLTATLTSVLYADLVEVPPVTKEFKITVRGKNDTPIVAPGFTKDEIAGKIKNATKSIMDFHALKDETWWNKEINFWKISTLKSYQMNMDSGFTAYPIQNSKKYVTEVLRTVENLEYISKNASSNANALQKGINISSALGYDAKNLQFENGNKVNLVEKLNSISLEDAKKGWYSTIAPYVLAAYRQVGEVPKAVKDAHVDYLLEELKKEESWKWGVDTPAMIVYGLAKYYNEDAVKTEIDKAVVKFSEKQDLTTGSFGSANSDAVVIIALSSIGINPSKDDRFVKGGKSVLDGLLAYKLENGEGFGYTNNQDLNAIATEQGMLALMAAYGVNEAEKPFDVFDFTKVQKKPLVQTDKDDEAEAGMILARFEKNTQKAKEGDNVVVKLLGKRTDTEAAELLPIADADIYDNGELIGKTGADGSITIKNISKGTHIVAAKKKDPMGKNILTLNSCVISVSGKEQAQGQIKPETMVKFRLIGANKHEEGKPVEYVTWIATKSFKFDIPNPTVYDVFTRALDEAGLQYVGAENNYVKRIKAPALYGDYWLGEFDNGKNSGWMYTVNGVHVKFGLKDLKLTDRDSLIWHYVDDYKKDENSNVWLNAKDENPSKAKDMSGGSGSGGVGSTADKQETAVENKTENITSKVEIKATVDKATGKAEAKIDNAKVKEQLADMVKQAEKAEKEGKKEVVKELKLEVKADKAAKAVEAVIPKEAVKNMAEKADAVKIDTNLGTVSLDKKVLADLSAKADKEVSVVLEKKEVSDTPLANAKEEDVKKAEGRPIVELKATVDGKAASVKGNVNVSLKYEKQSSEQAEAVVVYKVLPNGAMQIVKESDFDAAKAEVKIDVKNAEGTYVIGYNKVEFTDANSHWASKNITFLAAREVVKGKEAGKFVPESKVSRAEFAQILANLSGADLSKYNASKFTDVASDSWYAGAVAWATEMGITGGVGDGNFAPEAAISRQDMAVMIERYLKSGDRNLKAKKKEVKFADASNVASYAQNAVATMQRAGIINGAPAANGTLNFNPTASASRAETVTMIANYIRN